MTIISIVLIIVIIELAYLYYVTQRMEAKIKLISDCVDKLILCFEDLRKVASNNTEMIKMISELDAKQSKTP